MKVKLAQIAVGRIAGFLLRTFLKAETAPALQQAFEQIEGMKQAEQDAVKAAVRRTAKIAERCDTRDAFARQVLSPMEDVLDMSPHALPWSEQDAKIAHRYFASSHGQRMLHRLYVHARRTLDAAMWKEQNSQRMVDAAMGIRLAIGHITQAANCDVAPASKFQNTPTAAGANAATENTADAGDTAFVKPTASTAGLRASALRERYRP